MLLLFKQIVILLLHAYLFLIFLFFYSVLFDFSAYELVNQRQI